MLYLSLLTLNPRSRQAQSELRDPYQLHRTLSKAFGDSREAQQEARCLFRIEESDRGIRVLMQSHQVPVWGNLTASADYFASSPIVKPFNPLVITGRVLGFRLLANPTKRLAIKTEGKKLGDRVGLYREEEQLAWLARKAAENGFEVLTVRTCREEKQACQTRARRATFSSVQFDGVLRVTDAASLRSALEGGIGAGKGFGFGLLSLAALK